MPSERELVWCRSVAYGWLSDEPWLALADPSSMAPAGERLCLLSGCFAVEATLSTRTWSCWRRGRRGGRCCRSLTTEETGFFWLVESENIGLAGSALNGRDHSGCFWLLYGALLGRGVRDHRHGRGERREKTYRNREGTIRGQVDLRAFRFESVGATGARMVEVRGASSI